ncbi:MAG: hypothetical protein K2Y20_04300 [Sphingomonas sp.]|nr:hypothetical protein [Sphingomonas sp.]
MRLNRIPLSRLAIALAAMMFPAMLLAGSGEEKPVERRYVAAPPAPMTQTQADADAKSAGCTSCHVKTDQPTMHETPAVILGCTDCHGGNAAIVGNPAKGFDDVDYVAAREKAHVLPRYPKGWHYPSSANPKASYTLLNREAPEFVRFVNPGDYRVARQACGACHLPVIEAGERSIMASGAMLWGGASYNNGILPYKNYLLGEAYTADGKPAKLLSPGAPPGTITAAQKARGALAALYPLPEWEVVPPGDIFRVFEAGGRVIGSQFAEVGLPNPSGAIQRLDEPGRPDLKQSNRGAGTGLRIAVPVLNIHKTRLNDPFMWFMGTNDQPGDYRGSGCTGCHVIYANDREPRHSLIYAAFGRDGQTQTVDPTIASRREQHGEHGALVGEAGDTDGNGEKGHPIKHAFTRAIPTSQCMSCHMHQPNIFLNSYLGYTMWDYESDAPSMWPEKQKYPTAAETREVLDRNPEGAAPRGKWGDVDFLRNVYDLNPTLKDTQFADYHSHGWNFRAIFKRDREGNLLDADGKIVAPDDPEKWRKNGEDKFVQPGTNPGKAVHLMDIHAEKGMQCVDCHFAQDSHGNGLIYGEVANAIEIRCKDCHGTADAYPTLRTSGPAAPPTGNDLSLLRNPDGQRRFEWTTGPGGTRELIQRSMVDPKLSWPVHLVKNSVDPASPYFNIKAARAKLMAKIGAVSGRYEFGSGVANSELAHPGDEMACFTCHLSWTTSCGGCHLPIEANSKSSVNHYEGGETRNFATYNPQVARDDMFQLGRHMTTKGNEIVPVRSSSALILSSTNVNRERIYIQQPPISAIGFSSQAFAPHFPHTVRTTETKTCTDCHLSAKDDNNAIMAQLLLLGTGTVNFVGLHAWTGLERGFEAVRVTEWDEPQAVIGSHLQKYAYPDYWRAHIDGNKRELRDWTRGKTFDAKLSGETQATEQFRNIVQGTRDSVRCLQLRGEYMFVAEGRGGFRAYDVASVGNKGFSDRIVSAPFSPLGHDAHVASRNATCMALPTNQPIAPARNTAPMREMNQEQAFLPIYHYAAITDFEEGLILVNVDTLADGNFKNNFLKRAVTWNPNGVLNGARHIILAGSYAYVAAKVGLVVVDLADPLHPKLAAVRPLTDARASAIQFRYLWVTDADGVKLFDVTQLANPVAMPGGTIALADAQRLYIARTYAYIAAKGDGLVIADVTNPLNPRINQRVTFGGAMTDARDVIVAGTNASLFAYVADGRAGLKVIQLTSPSSQPNFYGFSPRPVPELIAWAKTPAPALALSRGLDRDRAVDETGGQIAVFGRLGARPFTRAEMEKLFLNARGVPYKVSDTGTMADWRAPMKLPVVLGR